MKQIFRLNLLVAMSIMLAMILVASLSLAAPKTASASSHTTPESTNRVIPKKDDCKAENAGGLSKDNCGIIKMIVIITRLLSGIAGVVIVAALIWGGIMYSMAGADPSKVSAAKDRIFKAITALMLLIFGFAILQWLTPGGIL